eukprot:jgi/Astpho2/2867/Aster-01021
MALIGPARPQRALACAGGTKGIGAACVLELASLGAEVFFCSRSEADVRAAAEAWQQQGLNVQAEATLGSKLDILGKDGPEGAAAFATSDAALCPAVCNAGINIRKKAVEYSEEEYRTVMGINLDACFRLSQLSYPLLKASGSGSVVYISSVGGGPTAMFSAAIKQLARNLSVEWARDSIRVNDVAPGYVRTPLVEGILNNEDIMSKMRLRVPQKRVSDPEEISGAVAFLCSKAASYITGQTLAIDGGYSIMGIFLDHDDKPWESKVNP